MGCSSSTDRYVPAAGRAALTRLYDPVVSATLRGRSWRGVAADLPDRGLVIDVGCGTGAQALVLAALAGHAGRVIAVDGDPAVLEMARSKAGAPAVDWRVGLADALPVEAASADAVVMTLLLHHLDAAAKRAALTEAGRVLRPGGYLSVADWGAPRGVLPGLGARVLRALDGPAGVDDHLAGRLPSCIAAAGFTAPRLRARVGTVWGTLEVLGAERA